MSTALAVREPLPPLDFTAEQVAIIRKQIIKDATEAEFAVAMEMAKARRLSPITKQIYFIKRSGVLTAQVSIDGLRSIAQRTGLYNGQDPVLFAYSPDGKALLSATVTVYRKDWERGCAATAFLSEYQQPSNNLWAKMPHAMLSKCAEALALRKAFPEDMGGLYASEEMDQAETPVVARAVDVEARPVERPAPAQQPVAEAQKALPAPEVTAEAQAELDAWAVRMSLSLEQAGTAQEWRDACAAIKAKGALPTALRDLLSKAAVGSKARLGVTP